MAVGAAPFLSLHTSCISDNLVVPILRTGSLQRDVNPLISRQSQHTSAFLPVSALARFAVCTLLRDFASIVGLRPKSLLKSDVHEASMFERKSRLMLDSELYVSTGFPWRGHLFSKSNSFQFTELINYQGRNRRRATCAQSHLNSSCSCASLHLLGMPGTTLNIFNIGRLLATVAWMFVTPSEALAETCENSSNVFNMPLLFIIALVGATVGGLLARERKAELARLNEQLRQINAALRRQVKIESDAPNLSHAHAGRIPESNILPDPKKQELIFILRTGKNHLRQQNPAKALSEFKYALELAQSMQDSVEEKKAARGLGASLQRLGNFREAIKYHSLVLSVSRRTGEESGNTEAYGAIADCYTELGDLEQAGRFYDKYISRLEKD